MAEGYKLNAENRTNTASNSRDASSFINFDVVRYYPYFPDPTNKVFLDLTYLNSDGITLHQNLQIFKDLEESSEENVIHYMHIQHNRLDFLPENISKFRNLKLIDLSSNFLTEINEAILELKMLNVLIAKYNFLGDFSLPKKLGTLQNLEELDLAGNVFKTIPPEIINVKSLKALYMGANQLEDLPRDIWKLERLEALILGGNNLKDIPSEIGRLQYLSCLNLNANQLQSLPSTISCLRRLKSLLLDDNQLTTLPFGIVTLKELEMQLWNNPWVRFVQDITYDLPSLCELAARSIKLFKVPYKDRDLPLNMVNYLSCARRCDNPKCRGVYFDVRVEHIKFGKFCLVYSGIPLLQYLCSPRCVTAPESSTS